MSNYLVLSKDLLEHCARRAADYDRENGFFFENFEELRQANYLLAAVPKEFGGLGLTLAEIFSASWQPAEAVAASGGVHGPTRRKSRYRHRCY